MAGESVNEERRAAQEQRADEREAARANRAGELDAAQANRAHEREEARVARERNERLQGRCGMYRYKQHATCCLERGERLKEHERRKPKQCRTYELGHLVRRGQYL